MDTCARPQHSPAALVALALSLQADHVDHYRMCSYRFKTRHPNISQLASRVVDEGRRQIAQLQALRRKKTGDAYLPDSINRRVGGTATTTAATKQFFVTSSEQATELLEATLCLEDRAASCYRAAARATRQDDLRQLFESLAGDADARWQTLQEMKQGLRQNSIGSPASADGLLPTPDTSADGTAVPVSLNPVRQQARLKAASRHCRGRVVVVSNRVPSVDQQDAAAGGLATGLRAALEQSGGLWLGWNGEIRDDASGAKTVQEVPFTLTTFPLSREGHDGYYAGFANRTLWPVLHGRLDLMRYDAEQFAQYAVVNGRFAQELYPRLELNDRIWVHDYHLILLGDVLRAAGWQGPIGFFLHVPVPAPEILGALPCCDSLLRALTAYDLIGLQTDADVRNLRELFRHRLGLQVADDDTVVIGSRHLRLAAFPIGIDPEVFRRMADAQATGDTAASPAGEPLRIIGVDRLDYTKGLPNRLQSFGRLLERASHLHGKVELLQIAAPSRETVAEYLALRDELAALAGRINARHAEPDWTPVRYLNKAFTQPQLAGLYRSSRVALVTPLRDGMNLVAKEYVAAQRAADPGVLVLSKFAGAAERLDGALLVNPHDIDAVAATLRQALEMPLDERRSRWTCMLHELENNDIHDWHRTFLQTLAEVRPDTYSSAHARAFVPATAHERWTVQ